MCGVSCRVRFYVYVYAHVCVSCLLNLAITLYNDFSRVQTPVRFARVDPVCQVCTASSPRVMVIKGGKKNRRIRAEGEGLNNLHASLDHLL